MVVKSQVKYIQSLSQKKYRDAEGVFVAEGPKIINELLGAGNVVLQQLFAEEIWVAQHPQLAARTTVVKEGELERFSFLQTPNQVLGIFSKPVFMAPTNPPVPSTGWSLALDTIQDPGNMGTIVRCADWFGLQQVICNEGCADVFSPKVVQSTMGSISRVQVIYTDLPSYIQQHAEIVYAATLHGTPLHQLPAVQQGILLIGNESKGIHDALLAAVKHRITIPRKGQAESLNAAVATGVILSHLLK
jgi:TrmH family RNA methyltransferase